MKFVHDEGKFFFFLNSANTSKTFCCHLTVNHCGCIIKTNHLMLFLLRGDADKSLARTISRCRRTESIVSLERGICTYAELQVFSCYRGWKKGYQATRAISTTWRRELSSLFVFFSLSLSPLQDKVPTEIHVILRETLREHAPMYVTIKNWVVQFKRGD